MEHIDNVIIVLEALEEGVDFFLLFIGELAGCEGDALKLEALYLQTLIF